MEYLAVLTEAIVVGAVLGKHLPESVIRIGAAVLFFAFGVWLLLEGLFPGNIAGPIAGAAVVVLALAGAAGRTVWSRRRRTAAAEPEQMQRQD